MRTDRMETLTAGGKEYAYCPISGVDGAAELPYSLKVLLENVVRNACTDEEAQTMAARIVEAARTGQVGDEVEFSPARVLFQDFTGVPVFVDFAVMREACADLGGDPAKINPQIPCDMVIDHSVIADVAGCPESLEENQQLEYQRNKERYEFLKWAQASFQNVRIVPPGQGICHQLNIEQFAQVVMGAKGVDAGSAADCSERRFCSPRKPQENDDLRFSQGEAKAEGLSAAETESLSSAPLVYFDTLVGTDSHTPTANGIGILGWGVGGIEAEAAALGQPITTLVPRVIGIRMTGSLAPGVAAMDVSLTLAQVLRQKGVVGCFVECFGPGIAQLSATQRACISNMTPEYGCTCTLFPVDRRTIDFLHLTGRSEQQTALVEAYAKAQGFWSEGEEGDGGRRYSEVIELDLSAVKPSISGPSRPHDRFDIADAGRRFREVCEQRGLDGNNYATVDVMGGQHELKDGAIAIAAVTSCTTATDPSMMVQAGVIARNAAQRGLSSKPWVKTILAPGSHSTEMLLQQAGLLPGLQKLGFYTCGFGCMSCIGNSGPLSESMHEASTKVELASVLSGNRNFEGRISPDVSQNYLTTPAHVVAYAIAGTMDFDFENDPLGCDPDGNPVFLRDIAPDQDEVDRIVAELVVPSLYDEGSGSLYGGDEVWQALNAKPSDTFEWDGSSTYVRRPPYFDGMKAQPEGAPEIRDAVVLGLFGDFITTDHISPAGAIAPDSPAADYLHEAGVSDADFNTYGSRRGNHEVMMRGTFANVKLQNALAGGRKGGYTRDAETGDVTTMFDAACRYLDTEAPSIVIAGKMYGSGSSRDWAAKGPMLLGVKAAIAESFERIHRSNLIGMGILPLQFEEGQNAQTLGLDGTERYTISNVTFSDGVPEDEMVNVVATKADGTKVEFRALVRIDTPTEGKYYENGGILQYVLRELA